MTVKTAIAAATDRLASAGCSSPRIDAERLIGHVLGAPRSQLYAEPERELSADEERAHADELERRCRREPLAYVLGQWEFRNLTLRVTPAVLVPRPETEIVVERCLVRVRPQDAPLVLDIGTGSGAIGLSIASEHPGARVVAIDSSDEALRVAQLNARLLELDDRVSFVRGDLFAGQSGPFDLVVSNPPYVSADEYATLEREIVDYEPRDAVLGTGFHKRIAIEARSVLSTDGWLVLECGATETGTVSSQVESLGYSSVTISDDLAGHPRVVEAAWSAGRPPPDVR